MSYKDAGVDIDLECVGLVVTELLTNALLHGREPVEVAACIAWLCSPAASAVTGADVAVDGGMTIG